MAQQPKSPVVEAAEQSWKSAQEFEDQRKKAHHDRAAAEVRRRIEAGELDPKDERGAKALIADLLRQYQEEEARRAGGEWTRSQAELPPTTPEATPEEIAAATTPAPAGERAAQLDAEEQAAQAAAKARGEELGAVKGRKYSPEEIPSVRGPSAPTFGEEDLRRMGLRPGWDIKAILKFGKDGRPIYGQYMLGANGKFTAATEQMNKGLQARKDPTHGVLLMLQALKADPRYTVRVWRGERGITAAAYGPTPESDKIKAATGREQISKIGAGTPEQAQKIAEEAARARGVEGLPEPEARASGEHFGPAAPLTAPREEKFEPEGGWVEAGPEINDMVLDDEEDPSSPAIAWGDYWTSKTAEQITDDHTDPRDIDPRMADDPKLTKEQEGALRRKLAMARRMGGRGIDQPKTTADLTPSDLAKAHSKHRPDMSGKDREVTVTKVDDDGSITGIPGQTYKAKETVYGWETPPHDSIVHPKMAQNREHIRMMIPYLRSYFDSLKHFADAAIKPVTGDIQGWRTEFDRFGKPSDIPLMVSSDDVDDKAPCGNCGHPADQHEGWPNAALECQHPDCVFKKTTKSGATIEDSKCHHYKTSKLKTGAKAKKMKHGELSYETIDVLAKELATIPSAWGSQKTGVKPPPFSPDAIRKMAEVDPEKALEMQRAVSEWYTSFNPEQISTAPGEFLPPVPPNSRDDVNRAKKAGDKETADKMIKDNEEWYKRMEKRAKDNHTVLGNVQILRNWAEKARKNLWKSFHEKMMDRWQNEMFGSKSDDPKIDALQKKFVRNSVVGPSKGVGPDVSLGRRMAFSTAETQELPFAQKVGELNRKLDAARAGGEAGARSMSKWEMDDLKGIRMWQRRRPDLTPEAMEERLTQMQSKYQELGDKIKDHTVLGDSIIQFVNRLARSLAHSGGWGMGADKETMERRGSAIRHLGVDYPGKKKAGARIVPPEMPKITAKADVEAKKAAERATDPDVKRAEVAQAQHDVKMARLARQQLFKGTPKTAGEEPFVPPALAEEPLVPEISPEEAQQRAEYEEELRQSGIDPEKFYADIEGTSRDKMSEGLMRRLSEAVTLSTGGRSPTWWDDL